MSEWSHQHPNPGDELRLMTAPPMRIRLFAWWGGYVQGTGCGVIALGLFTVRSPWPFVAGLVLLLAGWFVDERVGRYAREVSRGQGA